MTPQTHPSWRALRSSAPESASTPAGQRSTWTGNGPREATSPPGAPSALQGEILIGVQALDALRQEWCAVLERMPAPSVFITPEFIETTLQYLLNPGDVPWFVVIRQQGQLAGLLPLVLGRETYAGLPVKVLQHAGTLSGDRPGLVCDRDPAEIWPVIIDTLLAQRRRWHLLDLRELDEGCCLLDEAGCLQQAAQRIKLHIHRESWTHAGCLPLKGSWDDYMASRSRNARQALRRRERQLLADLPDTQIEVIEQPERISAAFDRYLAIEAKGWKSSAEVGLWSDRREQALHHDLLPRLAASGRASVWLLKAGGQDIAGLVRLRQGGIHYERHAAFDPDFARYSPSTYLCMEAVRRSFGTDSVESDVLGMPAPLSERPAIYPWYPEERHTWRLTVLHLPWYQRPITWLKSKLLKLLILLRLAPKRSAPQAAP